MYIEIDRSFFLSHTVKVILPSPLSLLLPPLQPSLSLCSFLNHLLNLFSIFSQSFLNHFHSHTHSLSLRFFLMTCPFPSSLLSILIIYLLNTTEGIRCWRHHKVVNMDLGPCNPVIPLHFRPLDLNSMVFSDFVCVVPLHKALIGGINPRLHLLGEFSVGPGTVR